MKKRNIEMLLFFLLIATGFGRLSNMAFSWPVINGVAICTTSDYKEVPEIVSDGNGGAIITWMDWRMTDQDWYTNDWDIYAQAVDSTGSLKWNLDGLAICTVSGRQDNPRIISDGQGGAIITWNDSRNGHTKIYAQAIDSSGALKWTQNGVAICTASGNQGSQTIVSDGQGGVIITWCDDRKTPGSFAYDIYAQAVDSAGSLKWSLDGVAICTTSGSQEYPDIVSDGQDGAIITWVDYRTGDYDIYTQAIDGNGNIKWAIDGLTICTAYGGQNYPRIVSDEQKGAIITWMDYRNANCDIYAQAIDSTGSMKWEMGGVAICTALGSQEWPIMISDGQGGAIVTWNDYRTGTSTTDVYVQHIDNMGKEKWALNGIAVCTVSGMQMVASIVQDGENGSIIAWQDERNGNFDIFTQSVSSTGITKWMPNGIPICVAPNEQSNPRLVSNGYGGAIMTWIDYQNVNRDIYAQSINNEGIVPIKLSEFEAF
jgi:hypothetical protein